jgi:GNAT superfamily N-acetyltransferase
MIAIRRARMGDAAGIGMVHVASWRSAYPGVLPDRVLTNLSPSRQASFYDRAIRIGAGLHVAAVSGADAPEGAPGIVGFASSRPVRHDWGQGEIETLYVLDDWRERGLGRQLMRASAQYLAGLGCGSAFLWVLADNPARWFYQHLGGRQVAESTVRVGGEAVPQRAFLWDPIDRLF